MRQLLREVVADDKKYDADSIVWKISAAKNRLISADRFQPQGKDDHEQAAAAVYPRYQSALKAYNAIDFDDIIMLTVQLLEEHAAVREYWQQQFRYLLVDEYQDTNPPQYRLIRPSGPFHESSTLLTFFAVPIPNLKLCDPAKRTNWLKSPCT